MATPFLEAFAEAVLGALTAQDLIEIDPGGERRVVVFVAARLAEAREGDSLISSLSQAILAAPEVEELFADDELLKDLVTDLPPESLPRGGR